MSSPVKSKQNAFMLSYSAYEARERDNCSTSFFSISHISFDQKEFERHEKRAWEWDNNSTLDID